MFTNQTDVSFVLRPLFPWLPCVLLERKSGLEMGDEAIHAEVSYTDIKCGIHTVIQMITYTFCVCDALKPSGHAQEGYSISACQCLPLYDICSSVDLYCPSVVLAELARYLKGF